MNYSHRENIHPNTSQLNPNDDKFDLNQIFSNEFKSKNNLNLYVKNYHQKHQYYESY